MTNYKNFAEEVNTLTEMFSDNLSTRADRRDYVCGLVGMMFVQKILRSPSPDRSFDCESVTYGLQQKWGRVN